MPELPDILLYVRALQQRLLGERIESISVRSPSLLRTYSPKLESVVHQPIESISRNGKRIVWALDSGVCLVFHLMIAGRFHWKSKAVLPKGKNDLAAFGFVVGDKPCTLMLTEASSKRRAGLWCFESLEGAQSLNRGGLDVLACDEAELIGELKRSNNTLKRALTDPQRFDGIGNAYSDEILHAAKLSPLKRTQQLDAAELLRLARAMKETLAMWIERLQRQEGDRFPERVTAFREEMAVHGKFGSQCPECDAPIQRIRYVDNECNYCPRCQTEGRILADRSLSRLLKDDWPRSIDELE
jgi:formamidopyrimidine-DNA glycosylase